MSKRSIQKNKPRVNPPPPDNRIAAAPRNPEPGVALAPSSAGSPSGGLIWFLFLTGVVGIAVGAAFWTMRAWQVGPFTVADGPKKSIDSWKPEVWTPRTAEEQIVDRFVRLWNKKDRAGLELLGPAPVFDTQPVSQQTAETRQTDFFLRADLRIVDVWRGEPDGKGRQKGSPGRFTLVTKGNVSSPPLSIRSKKGIDPPSQLLMANPDLVVEVRKGKIYGLRSELHVGP